MEASDIEKEKNAWIIDKIELEPIALMEESDSVGKAEYNALNHKNNAQKLAGKRFVCYSIIPVKRKSENISTDVVINTSLANLIHASSLGSVLLQRQYFEVNDQVSLLLNCDWEHMPNIKYACAQVLAGSILLNERNGHATLVNTVEAYGYHRLVDIQHVKEEPKVGPTIFTADFTSKSIRIYIDHESWEKAKNLSLDTTARQLAPFNLASQLRQLRSQFHHPSTYYLCRASSFLAIPFVCQPFSVFTYANYENGGNKNEFP
ncbi:hypothetical protein Unana1_00085 [Umbelopsis nana]